MIGKDDFSEHWDTLKVDAKGEQSDADKRAAKVKNISLRLLNVEGPTQVLDLFEEEFISVHTGEGEISDNLASVEELFMLLYFFKSQIKNLSDV